MFCPIEHFLTMLQFFVLFMAIFILIGLPYELTFELTSFFVEQDSVASSVEVASFGVDFSSYVAAFS